MDKPQKRKFAIRRTTALLRVLCVSFAIFAVKSSCANPLFISAPAAAVNHHWQNRRDFVFLLAPPFRAIPSVHDVSQRSVLQNLSGGVTHIEEDLIQSPVFGIAVNQRAQLLRIAERRQRTISASDNFAEANLRRRPPQSVSTTGP